MASPVLPQEPPEFTAAAAALHSIDAPADVSIEQTPAPGRLAPFAAAIRAEIVRPGGRGEDDEELAIGRLILLGDPNGHEAWDGTLRLVSYIRTELEAELVVDPLLPEVAWRWLLDAARAHDVALSSPSGTVTRVQSHSFGDLLGDGDAEAEFEPAGELEIRASWSLVGDPQAHMRAWVEMLRTAAGLPPVVPGVTALPAIRGV
ncbi:MAG: DUF3000 domain-containing protein [Sporichthyaceae bacterium]